MVWSGNKVDSIVIVDLPAITALMDLLGSGTAVSGGVVEIDAFLAFSRYLNLLSAGIPENSSEEK